MIIDLTLILTTTSSFSLQLNRTSATIQQFSINYIACNSGFFLDVRNTLIDLTGTNAYSMTSSSSKTINVAIPYKSKSNSSNSAITFNTIGLSMIRTSHTF